jgi:hypothetical protein
MSVMMHQALIIRRSILILKASKAEDVLRVQTMITNYMSELDDFLRANQVRITRSHLKPLCISFQAVAMSSVYSLLD